MKKGNKGQLFFSLSNLHQERKPIILHSSSSCSDPDTLVSFLPQVVNLCLVLTVLEQRGRYNSPHLGKEQEQVKSQGKASLYVAYWGSPSLLCGETCLSQRMPEQNESVLYAPSPPDTVNMLPLRHDTSRLSCTSF